MGRISGYIGSQFSEPRGFAGKICCLIMNFINRRMYDAAADCIPDAEKILDIGYGNGYLIEKLYRRKAVKIAGVDISEDMKKAASERNRQGIRNGDIRLYVGDCCDLRFKDGTFDAVTTVNTIYFWEDTLKGMQEIYRVLGDGGVFCNVVYTKEWLKSLSYTRECFKFFEKEDYVRLARKAGFSHVTVRDISRGTNFAVICRK